MQNPITKKSQQGFTLIELLIVVAIIGILAAIAIPQYAQYRTSAMNSAAESELKNVQTSLEGYYNDENYAYPTSGNVDGAINFDSSSKVTISYELLGAANGTQAYGACAFHQSGDEWVGVNSTLSSMTSGECDGDSCSDCDIPGGSSDASSNDI